MLYVKNIGLSTAVMPHVESMADVLIENKIYMINRNSKHREAIKEAKAEANADGLEELYVSNLSKDSTNIHFLSQAFSKIKKETAIICIQTGKDGSLDAAVLVVVPERIEPAWAIITQCEQSDQKSKARIREVYREDGPVADALSVIEACISKYYGFEFQNNWSSEMFFDEKYVENLPIKCSLTNGDYFVSQAKGIVRPQRSKVKYIIPIAFHKLEDLDQILYRLRIKCNDYRIQEISKDYCMTLYTQESKNSRYVVFLAITSRDLENEINEFFKTKEHWNEEKFIWKSSMGSCYVSTPLEDKAKICYLSPPGGMFSKVQFYRLYRSFPQLRTMLNKNRLHKKSKNDLINKYYFEIITMMLTVEALKLIGVKQDAVIGGSLGELSIPLIFDVMMKNGKVLNVEDCSLDIMYRVMELIENLIESQPQLCRDYFGQEIEPLEKWYLLCDYELVKSEVDKFPEKSPIFITIIGSPKDIIICGTSKLCKLVIEELHCYATQFNDPIYAHTPVFVPKSEEMKTKVMDLEVHYSEDLPFTVYNTHLCEEVGTQIEDYADEFVNCLVKQVNMVDVLKKAYEDGCRIFIDLGSNMLCSRWANATFEDGKLAYVMSLYDNKIGNDSVLSLIAVLIANKIKFNYEDFIKWYFPEDKIISKTEETYEPQQKRLLDQLAEFQLQNTRIVYHEYLNMEIQFIRSLLHNSQKIEDTISEEPQKEKEYLFNYDQILEMTDGSMAKVLGPTYAKIDQYKVRARMPLPPYMFVSRILSMNATYGKFIEGSSIEAEYDVPYNSILSVSKNRLSATVYSEAGHVGILLAACMGVDEYFHGKNKFRITDVITKYVSDLWPLSGDTVRMTFVIDKFIQNGDSTLLICTYRVYLYGELIIEAKETGGFFTKEVIDRGNGIVMGKLFDSESKINQKTELYHPVTHRKKFFKDEVHAFFRGNYITCFGRDVVNSNTPYMVCEDATFVDEILDMSATGGKYGLGYIVASKKIEPSFWPFKCHFKNDPVLPGTIMLEGLSQILTFYQTSMGIFMTEKKFITKLNTGYLIKTKFRGEVKCANHTLIYKVYPKEVKRVDGNVRFIADGEVYCDGLQIIEQINLGMMVTQAQE